MRLVAVLELGRASVDTSAGRRDPGGASRLGLAAALGFCLESAARALGAAPRPPAPHTRTLGRRRGWNLTAVQKGALGGCTFIGMALGALGMGIAADRFGRVPILRICIAIALAFGLLSALSSSFWVLYALRLLFGIGVGGFVPVGNTLLIESSDPELIGFTIGLAANAFAVGGIFVTLLAIPVLPNLEPG